MQREWPLEVRGNVISGRGWIKLGEYDVAFDRHARTTGILNLERYAANSLFKGLLRIAIAKMSIIYDISPSLIMKDSSSFPKRVFWIDHDEQYFIIDTDSIQCIFGEVATLGNHDSDRFADVAHFIDRHTPMPHGLTYTNSKWSRPALDIFPYLHAVHTRHV